MVLRLAGALILLIGLFATPVLAAGGGGGGDTYGGPDWSAKSPDFRAGIEAIEKKDFVRGVELFSKAVAADPKDADAANFLGFSFRKAGDYPNAVKNYQRALELNPKHLGAHEYLGEAYLEMNDLPKAKEHLAWLDDICWLGCQEYRELKAAVQAYERKTKS